jgi:CheY-like chemotaxis protein
VTHKLLLADDSVTIQRVVELTFSGEDVHVITVGDGEQAIARIPVEQPDIVLADIGMPKRSGYEVAAFIKARPDLSHIPVLLLAGAFEPVDEARAQQVGASGVLVKPFEPQQVISRVRDLIDASPGAMSAPAPVAPPSVAPPAPVAPALSSQPQPAPVPAPAPAAAVESPRHEAPPAVEHHELPRTAERHVPRAPEPVTPPVPTGDVQLDDYFGRLDAAFAKLEGEAERPRRAPSVEEHDTRGVPTLNGLLGSSGHQDAEVAVDDSPSERNLVADMFAALFALEQGDAAPHVQPAPPSAAPSRTAGAALQVSPELVDEVTRRVIERLAPDAASDLVTQIVSEVAERLVREEIARIKSSVAARI